MSFICGIKSFGPQMVDDGYELGLDVIVGLLSTGSAHEPLHLHGKQSMRFGLPKYCKARARLLSYHRETSGVGKHNTKAQTMSMTIHQGRRRPHWLDNDRDPNQMTLARHTALHPLPVCSNSKEPVLQAWVCSSEPNQKHTVLCPSKQALPSDHVKQCFDDST